MNVQGKCYKCGGFLAVNDAEDAVVCPFCGKPIVADKAIQCAREAPQNISLKPVSSGYDTDFVVEKSVVIRCNSFTEKNIRIPDGIKAIGDGAFQGMNNIETVRIPDGVEVIGAGAFSGCRKLQTVMIPDSVELIDREVFNGCTGLKHIDFPDSVKRMEASALAGCTGLESVEIPSNIEVLPWRAFEGCTRLRSVTIPKSVRTIEDLAFAECTGLEEVIFECRHADAASQSGVRRIGMNAFRNCTSLSRMDLPDTVEFIGNQAFQGCKRLRSLMIPQSVKAIYPLAFADCTGLESVSFAGNTQLYQGSNPYQQGNDVATFFNCPKLLNVQYNALQEHYWAFPAYMKSQETVFMANGKCRHCGGDFRGMVDKICTVCKTMKDY